MNNAVLIQQIYPDMSFAPMLELTRTRNQAYCDRWDFDYQVMIGVPSEKYSNTFDGSWAKVELIRRALDQGYEYVVWLDADALIKDLDTDLRNGCPAGIGACWMRIPQLHHWNVGVLYMRNSPAVKDFIVEWLGNYDKCKRSWWREQGAFNEMGMKSRVVETISDRWNATINYTMVPDAVVLGFHGYGEPPARTEAMREALKSIQEAEKDAGAREVFDGKSHR